MTRLDADQIRQPISDESQAQLDALEVFAEIGSTNTYLLNQSAPPPGRFRVALAEHQTDGRGRMDRRWHSPASSGVCLSLAYTFAETPENLPCLTLAVGVGIAQALEKLGARGIGLKWPNDIVVRDGKLGGILTETRSQPGNTVVIGVGINIDLRSTSKADSIVSQFGYASDLASCMSQLPDRCVVSAAVIEALFNSASAFEQQGFAPFFEIWDRYDWLRGQRVSVDVPDGQATGTCEGIASNGALILRTGSGRQHILSGSVRLAKPLVHG
jgi:BirA family biotin operon repressor/biotin-[acetyl-CoA-carboxylase] ligase